MTEQEWEDLCDGCGKCCTLKRTLKSPNKIACPGLDVVSNRCMVYEVRQETWPCAKVDPDNVVTLFRQGVLPPSCAYVRHTYGLPPLENPPQAKHLPFHLASNEFKMEFVRDAKKALKSNSEARKSK